jgi:hypothetical protein
MVLVLCVTGIWRLRAEARPHALVALLLLAFALHPDGECRVRLGEQSAARAAGRPRHRCHLLLARRPAAELAHRLCCGAPHQLRPRARRHAAPHARRPVPLRRPAHPAQLKRSDQDRLHALRQFAQAFNAFFVCVLFWLLARAQLLPRYAPWIAAGIWLASAVRFIG